MKFAIFCKSDGDVIQYTESVLKSLAVHNGHEIVDPNNADMLLISVCDITQVSFVESIRKKYTDKLICVGGHAVIYYKLFGLFADFVNIGQGFEFFECQSIDEIKSLPCIWHREKDGQKIVSSKKIDWSIAPCANVTSGAQYYWGAVGCKNKCKFCLTSWTNPHDKNSERRIKAVLNRYPTATIVTNDSDHVPNRMTQSMMLLDFLERQLKKYAVYRLGIEFANDQTRKKYGKPFSNDQFYQALERAKEYGVRLKLFCIGGINTFDEWNDLFDGIPISYERPSWEVKFTNITYEMFTPIKKERYAIDIEKMFDTNKARDFVSYHKRRVWNLKALPCMGVADTIRRNILAYTDNMQTYINNKSIKKADAQTCINYLFSNKIFDVDYSDTVIINHHKESNATQLA
jgi:hypothetical protein